MNTLARITIPAQNARSSPLLRLPAELRKQIWQHVYGNARIRVSLPSHNKRAEASHVDLKYTMWEDVFYPLTEMLPRLQLPRTACKQFYSEATAALYASSTFEFDSPHTFRAFALSPHPCVSQIQKLSIPRLEHDWEKALTASLIGRLKSLRGVQLAHTYLHCRATHPLPHAGRDEWKRYWRMIRSFQQHKLEPHITAFRLMVLNVFKQNLLAGEQLPRDILELKPEEAQYQNALRLQADFKAALLHYTPRRLSRRAAGAS
ncbi:uncharacterized protein EKO05_0007864 [Ascochyta rabiei]|uniref:uncharacterized protein n=1 Tax=Didymella rabiei TaxID=5454 RepID=UPI0021FC37A1|nr:uncharacterized protein EKO05_0007864 [Ascochyta rabiei]UPX17515.1 hypothetical protein EKO05_0007864 [Ascochyta rabiei]